MTENTRTLADNFIIGTRAFGWKDQPTVDDPFNFGITIGPDPEATQRPGASGTAFPPVTLRPVVTIEPAGAATIKPISADAQTVTGYNRWDYRIVPHKEGPLTLKFSLMSKGAALYEDTADITISAPPAPETPNPS